ncbi:exodeoxyribonuclease V subunit gamma [Cardiobacteriaceae bacterium TAE3-ERU3]|nr:exodeoxyribonuclease V subunit gamma [Cardiobacteriaceae bacterium TAE3-ERU3]
MSIFCSPLTSMLYINQSTDADTLFHAFQHEYRRHIHDVFSEHTVIVPSMTIRDWLENRIADTQGISALFKAQFWGMFSWQLVERVTGDVDYEGHAPLSTAAMQWRMFAWFSTRIEHNGDTPADTLIERLTGDISHDSDAVQQRLWLLAGQLARIFTRYLAMRPEWLRSWANGQSTELTDLLADSIHPDTWPDWQLDHYQHIAAAQQHIWHTLFADVFLAREARLEQFWQCLTDGNIPPNTLPNPLFVYGFESVNADTIDFLAKLGKFTNIYVYHHTVSDGYFSDMVDDKWLRKLTILSSDDTDHYDSIHPLLSRFGKQQRSLFRLMQPYRDNPDYPHIQFIDLPAADSTPTTLLTTLQHEIHNLDPELLATTPLASGDDSLRVHACHGLMRQLEALRADIVRWLNADDTRQLADILIVLPDLSSQQAVVNAVFPPAGDYDGYYLPARLTGVTPPAAQNLWAALAGSFNLIEDRFDAESVLSWLHSDDVCAMLNIAPEAMTRITSALIDAGYRRGFDHDHIRATLDPNDHDDRFTFCYALDRLAAGLMMPSAPLYAERIVPQPGITMQDLPAIEALCHLANCWREQWRSRHQRMPVSKWLEHINQRLEQDFTFAANSAAYQTINLSLRELEGQLNALTNYDHADTPPTVPLRFVLDDIAARLGSERVSSEPSGVMTIGSIGAMRALPYKLIAFANANISDFPANPPDDRYDLIGVDRDRPGDHRPEHDDLAAFLDILLNAEQSCWIYYDAEQNGEAQLPATPVQELINYVETSQPTAAPLTIKHGSDPFHPDENNTHPAPLWRDVQQALSSEVPSTPFMALTAPAQLPTPDPDEHYNLPFRQLTQQLLNPINTLAAALDLYFSGDADTLPTLEPLTLDGLQQYALDDTLINAEHHSNALARLPLLPAGATADILHQQRRNLWTQRKADLLAYSQASTLTNTQETVVTIANHDISIELPAVAEQSPKQWLMLSPRSSRPKHILRLWLQHLLWQAHSTTGESIIALRDSIIHFSPVTDAREQLIRWLQVLHYSREQLWLLPIDVGYNYADPGRSDKTTTEKLIRDWRSSTYPTDNLAALNLFTRGYSDQDIDELIKATAEQYANTLYAPLFAHMQEIQS